jgi:hypothetical protein
VSAARALRTGALLLLALGGSPGSAPALEHPEVVLVHVEANVGGASGGHVALRLRDDVYHYQQRDDRLQLVREDWRLFRFGYNVLQNRPLHAAHLPLEREAWLGLRDHLASVYLEQQRALGELRAARLDVELLKAWLGEGEGFRARAAGLLDPDRPGAPEGVALQRRLEAQLGAGFASAEMARIEDELAAPPADAAATRRQRDHLVLQAALLALRDAHGLDPEAAVEAPGGPPTPEERAVLQDWARRLEDAIVALLRSPRPDRGRALLVATARHRALKRSLDGSKLWLLDVLPDDAEVLDWRAVRARRAEIAALAQGTRQRFREERARSLAGDFDERRMLRLEVLASRAAEFGQGVEDGAPVRDTGGLLVPQRGRVLSPPARRPEDQALMVALAGGRQRLNALQTDLQERYRYDLFFSNCATELVRVLNAGLDDPEAALGGRLEPNGGLNFVPFRLFDGARSRLEVSDVERIPSHRERVLEELRQRENDALVFAREANTLTSRVYGRRAADGSFLLFTDGAAWTRPLFGLVNLGWALADGALGVLTVPFDRGERLVQAGRGVLFSAPELVFVNIRKGSFDAATLQRVGAFDWTR